MCYKATSQVAATKSQGLKAPTGTPFGKALATSEVFTPSAISDYLDVCVDPLHRIMLQ